MPRIAIGLEYDGTAYAGWQSQLHAQGVQSVLETALGFVADHPVATICAGRTDAGVHATAQVVHFDTNAKRTERGWIMGANTNLPDNVGALWAREVSDEFHARYSALARSYRYVILNRMSRPSLLHQRVCWVREPLDADRMDEAAQALVGEHDFTSFRAAECQSRSPIRQLRSIRVTRLNEYVVIDVTANAFLHHMVRNIAGALLAVGTRKHEISWVADLLEIRERSLGGVTAPAGGLYLFGVTYPNEFQLPSGVHCSVWPPGPVLVM